MKTTSILVIALIVAGQMVTSGCQDSPTAPQAHAPPRVSHQPGSIKLLAEQLRQVNRVESPAVYYGGVPSEVYAIYERMLESATSEDLLSLLDDKNPAVRVYAFKGLKAKFPHVDLFPLLMARVTDSELVETQFGCIRSQGFVVDLLITEIEDQLSSAQRNQLITWLLENPNKLYARERALASWQLAPEHHATVRKLVKNGVRDSLFALAGYRDEADVPLIAEHLELCSRNALRAVERYPHPSFFPILAKIHQQIKGLEGYYYRAVAAYKTSEAHELLASVLNIPESDDSSEYYIWHAFSALIDHYDPLYTDLLFRFWEACAVPNFNSQAPEWIGEQEGKLIPLLGKADSQRTVSGVKAKFMAKDFHNHSESALRAMAGLFLQKMKPEEAFEYINRGLAAANVHQVPVLTEVIASHKPESSIPILFDRLTSTTNGHIQVPVARAILAYGRKDLLNKLKHLLDNDSIPQVTDGSIQQPDWGLVAIKKLIQEFEAAAKKR